MEHQGHASQEPTGDGNTESVCLAGPTEASSELGCLAVALAKDATSHLALQAAAEACKASEVFTPADLALACEAEVLPPGHQRHHP